MVDAPVHVEWVAAMDSIQHETVYETLSAPEQTSFQRKILSTS